MKEEFNFLSTWMSKVYYWQLQTNDPVKIPEPIKDANGIQIGTVTKYNKKLNIVRVELFDPVFYKDMIESGIKMEHIEFFTKA